MPLTWMKNWDEELAAGAQRHPVPPSGMDGIHGQRSYPIVRPSACH